MDLFRQTTFVFLMIRARLKPNSGPAAFYVVMAVTFLLMVPTVLSACVLTANTQNASCAVRGVVDHALNYKYNNQLCSPQFADTIEDCASLCYRRGRLLLNLNEPWPVCQSFKFTPDLRLCELANMNVSKLVSPKNHSKSVFYDYQCFDCGPRCNRPFGMNLLDNGDFESGLLGPWSSLRGGIGPGKRPSSTAWHAKPNGTLYDSQLVRLQQNLEVCKNEYYGFRFDWKAIPKNNKTTFSMSAFLGPTMPWLYNFLSNGIAVPWTTVYGFGKWTNNQTSNPVRFLVDVPHKEYFADFFIDNVAVWRVPAKLSTKNGTETFRNGGFESGAIEPWTVDTNRDNEVSIVSPGIKSKYAAQIYTPDYFGYANLTQVLTMKPYVGYLFHCTLNISTEAPRLIEIHFNSGTNMFPAPEVGIRKIQFPVMVAQTEVVFQFVATTNVTVDNFSLKEVEGTLYEPD